MGANLKGYTVTRQITTSTLRGVKVYDTSKKNKHIGKVHTFIFHPHKRAVIGFTVKRPDRALMFHRSDLFVPFDAFEIKDGELYVDVSTLDSAKSACKKRGIVWDDCIIWEGLSLITEEGTSCGHVGDVTFSLEDGSVQTLRVDKGASNKALLGVIELDASLVEGFKLGVGDKLATVEERDDDEAMRGALLVKPEALEIEAIGGVAEKAGAGYARAAHKVKEGATRAKEAADRAKPKVMDAAAKTEDAVNKGAFKLGEQLGKTRGMFSSFKQAYKEALDDESPEGSLHDK